MEADGTASCPFGLNDLPAPGCPGTGRALAVLQPGDSLLFAQGSYPLSGKEASDAWSWPILVPPVAGTAQAPITIASEPGQVATLIDEAGNCPLAGTTKGRDHVHFE